MTLKFAVLLIVAFVGYHTVSGTHLNGRPFEDDKSLHHSKAASLFNPLNHPVTFLGKLLNLRPLKFVRRLIMFPLKVVLKVIRIVLTPVRVLLLPVRLINRVIHILTKPFRLVTRFILNVLLVLPVIRLPTRLLIGLWRILTFPIRAINSGFRLVLGH